MDVWSGLLHPGWPKIVDKRRRRRSLRSAAGMVSGRGILIQYYQVLGWQRDVNRDIVPWLCFCGQNAVAESDGK